MSAPVVFRTETARANADPSLALRMTTPKKAKPGSRARVRPADGGIVWREEWNAFECLAGCEDFFHVGKAADRTPERLAVLREMLIADHTECWEFDDPKMAADARRHRKEKKRRENLKARGSGALDRQSVSWRGR